MYRYVKIQLGREWTTCMTFHHSSAEYTDWTELNPLNLLNPLNHLNLLNPYPGHKTKTIKTPSAWCKMSLTIHWCCNCQKILKQAWKFSVSHTITPFGSCIHRKAINKDKPFCPLDGILLQERLPHARQNGLFLFIALARMVAFIIMKVMVCFWFGR